MKTIKDIRRELHSWGKYWHRQQTLGGYASRSTVDRCREILETGIQISSDLHLHNNAADHIRVPDWVEAIDSVVVQLTQPCRNALRARYKMLGKGEVNALQFGLVPSSYEYYLKRAELEVMART